MSAIYITPYGLNIITVLGIYIAVYNNTKYLAVQGNGALDIVAFVTFPLFLSALALLNFITFIVTLILSWSSLKWFTLLLILFSIVLATALQLFIAFISILTIINYTNNKTYPSYNYPLITATLNLLTNKVGIVIIIPCILVLPIVVHFILFARI